MPVFDKWNPLHWSAYRQAALVFAFIFGGAMGSEFGLKHFDPNTPLYWKSLTMWGFAGAGIATAVDYLVQLQRNR